MYEVKIPAYPILEPLSRATSTTLSPLSFYPSDFLEISVNASDNFIVEAVGLKKVQPNILPSKKIKFIQTSKGTFYKDPDRHGYPSNNAASRWFNRVPERSQKGYGKYLLAGTDFTALVIHHVWPSENLIFKSEEAWLLYSYLLRRFLVQTKSAQMVADWTQTGVLPEMPEDFVEHPDLPLGPYQKVAMLASMKQRTYSLFMEQGTGKTPVVINRICLESIRKMKGKLAGYKKGMFRALIVCPKQVRKNWEREFERFATIPGKVAVLRGGKINRIKELIDVVRTEQDCLWSAAILSIDSIKSIWEGLKRIEWDLVVIDESHKIKNQNTHRFKTMMDFNDSRALSKMILTGTPVTNTIFDLWTQFEWLGKGLSGFTTRSAFKGFHGKWGAKDGERGVEVLMGYKGVPLIQERLARLAFLITKKDAGLDLPDKVYDIYEAAMTPEQAKIYREISNKLVVEIDNLIAANTSNAQLTVNHILTKLLRLAQVCSGYVTTDQIIDLDSLEVTERQTLQISENNPKVEAVLELLEADHQNDPNSKAIIWACFVEDIRVLSEKLTALGVKHVGYHKAINPKYRVRSAEASEDIINLDPECKVLIANPASAGVGQNFIGYDKENPEKSSTYVDHEIYFSCNWSAVDRIQSEDRAHRRGTRANVRITDLMIPGTVDEEIRNRVNAKRQSAMTIQDIRNILRNIAQGYQG